MDRNSVGLWIDAHHSTSETVHRSVTNCSGSWFKFSEFSLKVIYIFVTGSQSE